MATRAPTRESAHPLTVAGADRRDLDRWVEIGSVRVARGKSGALHVELHGDDTANLERTARVQLDGDPGTLEFRVARVEAMTPARSHARARIWLVGLADADAAASADWNGATISIPESMLEALPAGEYYWRDLIGLACVTEDGERLGLLDEILPTGSNDVLVVRDGDAELLVPALHDVIREVDLATREIRLRLPPGLREEPV